MANTMPGRLKYTTVNTYMGWVGILGSTKGLLRTTLPRHSDQEAHQLLGGSLNRATLSPQSFEDLAERLRAYFSGHKATFLDRLDLSRATFFQCQAWEATRLIPYGETRSYQWLAGHIKQSGAAQAVGQALSRNPLPVVIPCHRVLNANGTTSGYSGGVGIKKRLLSLEASVIIK